MNSTKTLLLIKVSGRIRRVHADQALRTTLGTAQTNRKSSATVFLSFRENPIVSGARFSMITIVLSRLTRSKLSQRARKVVKFGELKE